MNPGIIEFEAPFDISNVMLVCPKCDEATRVAVERSGDTVQRKCKNCGALLD
jgi:large subunit ribosomal protein L24